MPKKPLEALEEYFSKAIDPPIDRRKAHKLIDMIVIAICAVICGAEGWTDIENFGNSKLPWLKPFWNCQTVFRPMTPLGGYSQCWMHSSDEGEHWSYSIVKVRNKNISRCKTLKIAQLLPAFLEFRTTNYSRSKNGWV